MISKNKLPNPIKGRLLYIISDHLELDGFVSLLKLQKQLPSGAFTHKNQLTDLLKGFRGFGVSGFRV